MLRLPEWPQPFFILFFSWLKLRFLEGSRHLVGLFAHVLPLEGEGKCFHQLSYEICLMGEGWVSKGWMKAIPNSKQTVRVWGWRCVTPWRDISNPEWRPDCLFLNHFILEHSLGWCNECPTWSVKTWVSYSLVLWLLPVFLSTLHPGFPTSILSHRVIVDTKNSI